MAASTVQQDQALIQPVSTHPAGRNSAVADVKLAQSVGAGFTDGMGGVVTPGQVRTQSATQLAKEMHEQVDKFRDGQVGFSELQQLKQSGQALLRSGVTDPEAAAALQRALARIDAQGRSLGDDAGWDVVQMLKDNRALAQQGKLTYAQLSAAVNLSEQVQGKHGGHWAAGAGQNVDAMQQDLRTRYLPEVQRRERKEIEALEQARQRYEAQPTAPNRHTLQQRRDALNERFNDNGFAPENGEVLQGLLRAANVTLAEPQTRAQSRLPALQQELGSAVQAYQQQRTPANRKLVNDTLAELRSERAGTGHSGDTALMRKADKLLDAPLKGQVRYRDVDPDGGGTLDATYVGVKRGDGSTVQTRVRIKETYDGDRWVASYQAVGVTITDANGKLVSERGGRVYDLKGERGAALASAEQAVERARQLLQAGAISTRDTPRTRTEPGNPVLSPTNDGRFESTGLIIPAGIKGLGNPYVAELRGVLDTQVVPDAQRYLQSGNALISLRGNDLQNYVGVAMNLAPNVVPVKGGGSQVLYQGEALQAIAPVAQAIQKAGGDAPEVRAVPVYLRVGDDKMAKTTIFRVRGDDGGERIVDQVGRTYDSMAEWKKNNKLGAVDVYVPKDGLAQADGNGKVLFEAFNNRRFDNTALPVIQGGVAVLGAGAGVAVILSTGGLAAPVILAGASAFSAGNGTLTLFDRNRHGQTLSLSDGEARSAWLEVAGGLLGVGAIGTGNRAVAATSDVVDLITLGDGGQRYVRDFNRMSVGERVVAGAQLMFWGAMLGADKVRGGKGRFDFDALTTRIDQVNGGNDYRTVGGNGTPQAPEIQVPNRKPQNSPVTPGRGGDVTIDVSPQPSPEQIAGDRRQQVAAKQFNDPAYQASLRQRLKEVAGDDPGRIDALVADAQQLDQLTRPIARDQLEQRMFAGSGVPESVRTQFLRGAEAWAQQQVQTRGGTVASHLETLALQGGQTRANLLRPLVAEQMGGGNERLTESAKQQLRGKGESELKSLLVTKDGQPSQAYVNTVRSALVERWSDDFNLNPAERGRLEPLVQQRLAGKVPEQQRVELVNLANSTATRDSLVKQANQTPAQRNVQPGTINSRTEPPVVTERPKVPVLNGAATPPANVPDPQRLTEWAGQLVAAVNNDPNGATMQLLRSGRGLAYADTNVVARLIDTDAGPVIRVLDPQQQTLREVPLSDNATPATNPPVPPQLVQRPVTGSDPLAITYIVQGQSVSLRQILSDFVAWRDGAGRNPTVYDGKAPWFASFGETAEAAVGLDGIRLALNPVQPSSTAQYDILRALNVPAALLRQANQTPPQPNVQPGTITSRTEPPVVIERPNVPVLNGAATPPANVPDPQRLTEWAGQLVAAVNNDPNGATVQLLRSGRGLANADSNVVAKLIDTDAGPVIRVLDPQQQTLLEVPLTANVNAQDSQPTPNVAGMGAREFEAAYLQAYNGTSTGAPNPQEAARLFATWRPAEARELWRISNETGAPFDALVALRVGGLEITRTEESRSAAPVVEELARSGLVAFNQVRAQEVASGTDAVTTDFQYVVHNVVAAPGQQDAYTRIADAVEPYLGMPDSEGKSRATFFGSQAPQEVIDEAAGALRGRLPRLYGDKTNEQIIESESLLNREIVVLVGADRNVSFDFGAPRIVEVIPPGGGNLRPDEYRQRLIEFAGALSRQNVTYGGKTTDQIIEETHLADKTLFFMRDARDPNNIATMTASVRTYGAIQALSGENFPAGDYLYLGQLAAPQSLPGAGKEKIAALQSMVVNSQHGLGDTPPLEGIALYTNNPTNIGFYLKAGFHLTAVRVDDSGKYGYYFRWHPEHSEGLPIRSYWVESEHGGGEPPPTVNAVPTGVRPNEEVAPTGESATEARLQQQVPQSNPLPTEAPTPPQPQPFNIDDTAPGPLTRVPPPEFTFSTDPTGKLTFTIGTQPFLPSDPALAATTLDQFVLGTAAAWNWLDNLRPVERATRALGNGLSQLTRPIVDAIVELPREIIGQVDWTEVFTGQPASVMRESDFQSLAPRTRDALRNVEVVTDNFWARMPVEDQQFNALLNESVVESVEQFLQWQDQIRQGTSNALGYIPTQVWNALPEPVRSRMVEIWHGQPGTTMPQNVYAELDPGVREALRNVVVMPDAAWDSLPPDVQQYLSTAAQGNVFTVDQELRLNDLVRQVPGQAVTRVAETADFIWQSAPVKIVMGTAQAIGFIAHKGVTALMVLEMAASGPRLHFYDPTTSQPITEPSLQALTIAFVPKTDGTVAVTLQSSLLPEASITFWASGPVMRNGIPRADHKEKIAPGVSGASLPTLQTSSRIISTWQANPGALGAVIEIGTANFHWAQGITLRPFGEIGANPFVFQASTEGTTQPGRDGKPTRTDARGSLDVYGLGVIDPPGFTGTFSTLRIGQWAVTPDRNVIGLGPGYKLSGGTAGLRGEQTPFLPEAPASAFQLNPAYNWEMQEVAPLSGRLSADGKHLQAVWSVDADGKPKVGQFVQTQGAFQVENQLYVDPATGWMAVTSSVDNGPPLWLHYDLANAAKVTGQARGGTFDPAAFDTNWRQATLDQWVQALQTEPGTTRVIGVIQQLGRGDVEAGLRQLSAQVADPNVRKLIEGNAAYFKALLQPRN
jgi:hypothetical protein